MAEPGSGEPSIADLFVTAIADSLGPDTDFVFPDDVLALRSGEPDHTEALKQARACELVDLSVRGRLGDVLEAAKLERAYVADLAYVVDADTAAAAEPAVANAKGHAKQQGHLGTSYVRYCAMAAEQAAHNAAQEDWDTAASEAGRCFYFCWQVMRQPDRTPDLVDEVRRTLDALGRVKPRE